MLSREEIHNLAELARLKLSPAEEESLQKDISAILEYVGQVSAVALPEKASAMPVVRNAMREDAPRDATHPLNNKEEALRAAFPVREGGFNLVRKIIQKDE